MKAWSLLLLVVVGCGGSDFGYAAPIEAVGGLDAGGDTGPDSAGAAGSSPDAQVPDDAPDSPDTLGDTVADTLPDTQDAGGAGGSGSGGTPAGGSAGDGGAGGVAGLGGTGGSAGDGGSTGGAAGSGGTGGSPCPSCGPLEECSPAGICVSKTVWLTGYGIDATETTRGQYAAWLATEPDVLQQPAYNAWNTTFEPGTDPSCVLNASPDSPIVCVDHGDAEAYCSGVGKRLCEESRWYDACVGGTMSGCVVNAGSPADVASSQDCQTLGVYDAVGNVQEIVATCSAQTGTSDQCWYRGGTYQFPASNCDSGNKAARSFQSYKLGFRCCSNP